MVHSLRTLEAKFLKHVIEKADKGHGKVLPDGTTQWGGFDVDTLHYVNSFQEADGVTFLCPKCFTENKGKIGTHGIHIYFHGKNVPDRLCIGKDGKGVKWNASGTSLDDLVLTPSILLLSGCEWHGFVGSNGIPPGHAG